MDLCSQTHFLERLVQNFRMRHTARLPNGIMKLLFYFTENSCSSPIPSQSMVVYCRGIQFHSRKKPFYHFILKLYHHWSRITPQWFPFLPSPSTDIPVWPICQSPSFYYYITPAIFMAQGETWGGV